MNEGQPGYYAVIPAQVRYDQELRPNAKLLYGELTALAGPDGYCWASDKYFAELFGLSPKTVNELVQSLLRRGYIRIEMAANQRGPERHIYAGSFLVIPENEVIPENRENLPGGYPEKSGIAIPEKSGSHKDNNLNNLPEFKPPQIPLAEKAGKKRRAKSVPDYEPEMFERFWKAYPRGEDRQGAAAEWDKLRPDMELMRAMGRALERQKATEEWQRGIGIPYAVRWLRKRRWEDEARETAQPPGYRLPERYLPEVSETW